MFKNDWCIVVYQFWHFIAAYQLFVTCPLSAFHGLVGTGISHVLLSSPLYSCPHLYLFSNVLGQYGGIADHGF